MGINPTDTRYFKGGFPTKHLLLQSYLLVPTPNRYHLLPSICWNSLSTNGIFPLVSSNAAKKVHLLSFSRRIQSFYQFVDTLIAVDRARKKNRWRGNLYIRTSPSHFQKKKKMIDRSMNWKCKTTAEVDDKIQNVADYLGPKFE